MTRRMVRCPRCQQGYAAHVFSGFGKGDRKVRTLQWLCFTCKEDGVDTKLEAKSY